MNERTRNPDRLQLPLMVSLLLALSACEANAVATPTPTATPGPTPTEKVAYAVGLYQEMTEGAPARELAERTWFMDPAVEGLDDGQTLLPMDGLQKLAAQETRYQEIMALRKLGVGWDIIEDFIGYTRVGRIEKAKVTVGGKVMERSLSFAVRARNMRSEITAADFGFSTLPHEDGHNLVWVETGGLNEAAATWWQYFVNGGAPKKPPEFMGCGLAPGDFDYNTGYHDFEALSIWFGLRTGENLFATMVKIYGQWAGHPLERIEQPMPMDYLYGQIGEKFQIPQSEIQKRFEAPESFRCR